MDKQATEIKFCEDCKFCDPGASTNGVDDMCSYPRELKGLLVVRRGVKQLRTCSIERTHCDADSCGPAGKWFQSAAPDLATDDSPSLEAAE